MLDLIKVHVSSQQRRKTLFWLTIVVAIIVQWAIICFVFLSGDSLSHHSMPPRLSDPTESVPTEIVNDASSSPSLIHGVVLSSYSSSQSMSSLSFSTPPPTLSVSLPSLVSSFLSKLSSTSVPSSISGRFEPATNPGGFQDFSSSLTSSENAFVQTERMKDTSGLRVGDIVEVHFKNRFNGSQVVSIEFFLDDASIIFHASFRFKLGVVVMNTATANRNWTPFEESSKLPLAAVPSHVTLSFSILFTSTDVLVGFLGNPLVTFHLRSLELHRVTHAIVSGNVDILRIKAPWLWYMQNFSLEAQNNVVVNDIVLNHQYRVFVGVLSSASNVAVRNSIRLSWFHYEAFSERKVLARFFVGRSSDDLVNQAVVEEASKFGDVVICSHLDSYRSVGWKTLEMVMFVSDLVHADYLLKCDDDTFVRVDELITRLEQPDVVKDGLYMGFISSNEHPNRDPKSKWYLSFEEYKPDVFPPFAHGPGYVVSANLCKHIAAKNSVGEVKVFPLEDISMATWVDSARRSLMVTIIHDSRFNFLGCSNDMITGHYVNSNMMYVIWTHIEELTAKGIRNGHFC